MKIISKELGTQYWEWVWSICETKLRRNRIFILKLWKIFEWKNFRTVQKQLRTNAFDFLHLEVSGNFKEWLIFGSFSKYNNILIHIPCSSHVFVLYTFLHIVIQELPSIDFKVQFWKACLTWECQQTLFFENKQVERF